MHKIPFFIGYFLSCFVPGRKNRRRVRGYVNVLFFYIPIVLFIKRVYKEPVKKVRFVRQISMKRMTCVVNEKYFVKVFRFVSVKRLNDYKLLLDAIRPYLTVKIPKIFVAKYIPMYVDEKLPGTSITDLDKKDVIKHERKIKSQIYEMISSLQGIPLQDIPNKELFVVKLQSKIIPQNVKISEKMELAHGDLNPGNLLVDDSFNVVSIIDWDSVSLVQSPDFDRKSFDNLWDIYKQ